MLYKYVFRAHKCSLITDIAQNYPTVNLLFTPSNTPEFSPVENLFGFVKQKLSDFEFTGEKGK